MLIERYWTIRPAEPGDLSFVVKTWLQSYAPHAKQAHALKMPYLSTQNRQLGAILSDAYYQHTSPLVQELVDRCPILVACMPEEPDVIVGWVCGELHSTGPSVLHYTYTKGVYRKHGVAKSLVGALLAQLGSSTTIASHVTPATRAKLEALRFPVVPVQAFTKRHNRQNR